MAYLLHVLFTCMDAQTQKTIEKMIAACVQFGHGEITFNQLWYRVRGDQKLSAIQKILDTELGYLLYQLYMDFICWKDDRDDIIRRSAFEVFQAVHSDPRDQT